MLVVHIGLHKAGSSTIQKVMAARHSWLEERGVCYPLVGRGPSPGHHNLVFQVRGSGQFKPKIGGLEEVAEMARAAPSATFCVSSEGFESLAEEQVQEVRRRLGSIDAMIVVYVRDFATAWVSRYTQCVKVGITTLGFDEYFSEICLRRFKAGLEARPLQRVAAAWAGAFGAQNVRFRSLDSRDLIGGDLVTDFMSTLGISDLEGCDLESVGRANVRPGWKLTALLRDMHITAGAHREAALARKELPGRAERMESYRIWRIGKAAARQIGLDKDPGRYLTREQRDLAHKLYAEESEAVRQIIPDCLISSPETDAPVRTFPPTLEKVPEQERAAFQAAVAQISNRGKSKATT